MFIEYSNTVLIIILAVLAAIGVVAVFSKKLRGKAGLSAICFAALAAFALEATAFNFLHYLKYFAGPPAAIIGVSEEDGIKTSDDTKAEFVADGIRFSNLNRKVSSVFIDIDFKNTGNETVKVTIKWTDEGITQEYVKNLYRYLPHENYVPLQPSGKVSELTIMFYNSEVEIRAVEINKPIPFYFSGLRLLVVSLLLFAVLAILNKTLRAKAARYLFEYKFDPKNVKQNLVYAGTVALLILFSWVCVFTSIKNWDEDKNKNFQYNRYLVDALIDGRTNLNYGNPEKLLTDEKSPYDYEWLKEVEGDNNVHDWAWYKGKYYCYYGVVPAVCLYVPYKLIFGDYLSQYTGVFLFCAITVILFAALWRYCVNKYMRDFLYALYYLSFLALFFASGLFVSLRSPNVYSIARSSGLMFTVAGILLLLKSVDNEKISRIKLFFACLCLALVFGCRPNMGLASLLVPVVLWKRRTWKLFAFAMLPYIIVAIPLCIYNYARFESIFEFGHRYTIPHPGNEKMLLLKIYTGFTHFVNYLLAPNIFSLQFPFVRYSPEKEGGLIAQGIIYYDLGKIGLVNFPMVFLLIYMFKKIKPKTFYVLSASLIVAVLIMIVNSIMVGCSPHYLCDTMVFVIFPSLFCAYYWSQDGREISFGAETNSNTFIGFKMRLSLAYILIAASIFIGLFFYVSTPNTYSNPTLYRYLEQSLNFFAIN
jgi:hypothetical protein